MNTFDNHLDVKKIACVLPPVVKGSGGHRTILNNINKLGKSFEATIDIYVQPHLGMNKEKTRQEIIKFFGMEFDNIFFDTHIKTDYDIVVASMWNTVDMVSECDCDNKFYFVQDYEPWFYPMGNTRIQAENSYSEELNHIVFGRWLSNMVRKKAGRPVWNVDFCADHDTYYPVEEVKVERAICAIWQPEKPRRMHELLLEALKILEIADPDLKVYLYGSESKLPIALNNVEFLGILDVQGCNSLYNKCICGISLSASNPSRIPFEMMTSGLPVIELYRENNLFDMPDDGVLLCNPNPESLAEAVLSVVNNPDKRERMHNAGIEYMKDRLLDNEASDFVKGVECFIAGKDLIQNDFHQSYTYKTIKAGRELSIIAREIKRHDELQIVYASAIRFVFETPSDDRVFDRYCLAVWKEQDQSDLIWLKLRKEAGGRAEYLWSVPDDASEGASYNLHLYKKSGSMQYVGSWIRVIKKSSDNIIDTIELDQFGCEL